ncbi:MAG: hypothetical protein KAS32_11090 [Candidatus Peribacteraceae bacterium]|nr:hypothetical protein [Candidatus Peribacteraceae bacterium]
MSIEDFYGVVLVLELIGSILTIAACYFAIKFYKINKKEKPIKQQVTPAVKEKPTRNTNEFFKGRVNNGLVELNDTVVSSNEYKKYFYGKSFSGKVKNIEVGQTDGYEQIEVDIGSEIRRFSGYWMVKETPQLL